MTSGECRQSSRHGIPFFGSGSLGRRGTRAQFVSPRCVKASLTDREATSQTTVSASPTVSVSHTGAYSESEVVTEALVSALEAEVASLEAG